jgi:hypothetical protein
MSVEPPVDKLTVSTQDDEQNAVELVEAKENINKTSDKEKSPARDFLGRTWLEAEEELNHSDY